MMVCYHARCSHAVNSHASLRPRMQMVTRHGCRMMYCLRTKSAAAGHCRIDRVHYKGFPNAIVVVLNYDFSGVQHSDLAQKILQVSRRFAFATNPTHRICMHWHICNVFVQINTFLFSAAACQLLVRKLQWGDGILNRYQGKPSFMHATPSQSFTQAAMAVAAALSGEKFGSLNSQVSRGIKIS